MKSENEMLNYEQFLRDLFYHTYSYSNELKNCLEYMDKNGYKDAVTDYLITRLTK